MPLTTNQGSAPRSATRPKAIEPRNIRQVRLKAFQGVGKEACIAAQKIDAPQKLHAEQGHHEHHPDIDRIFECRPTQPPGAKHGHRVKNAAQEKPREASQSRMRELARRDTARVVVDLLRRDARYDVRQRACIAQIGDRGVAANTDDREPEERQRQRRPGVARKRYIVAAHNDDFAAGQKGGEQIACKEKGGNDGAREKRTDGNRIRERVFPALLPFFLPLHAPASFP